MSITDYTFDGTTGDPGTLTVNEGAYDANAVYTITYPVAQSALSLDLRNISSTPLLTPEEFPATDQNNRLELSYYPYVEYQLVNDSTAYWSKPEADEAAWRFHPSVANVTSADGSRIVFSTLRDFDVLSGEFSGLTGVDEVCLHVKDGVKRYEVTLSSTTAGTISEDFDGDTGVEFEYEIGECQAVDGQIFGLDNVSYEPISVFVNDQKAVNVTSYETLEHPAFLPGEPGRRHQYIHAGRYLYFNNPINDATIEVFYRWKTQYLRLLMQLRSNFPIFTEVTPKVVDGTVKLKTTRL
jgi:hypothetical protein